MPDRTGIRDHVRLGVEVLAVRWDDDTATWHLTLRDGDGERTEEADAVVGIGASAIQFVPAIAEQAASLTLFQRSSNYVAPKADGPLSDRARRLMRVDPIRKAYRFGIWARFDSRFLALREGSWMGRLGQKMFDKGLRPLVSDDLSEEAVVPDYPLGCKRILISNDWYPTLLRPDVSVVTGGVEKVEADAVMVDGVRHPVDALVFGTGFESTGFLVPMKVTGRRGADLHEVWADGAEAHLGITVSGFPNLFMLYGPNTNLGHNSIIFMLERQISYALSCMRTLVDGGRPLDVRPGAQAASNRRLVQSLDRTVWAASCHSWYKTASGRITNNWSGPTIAYWARTVRPRWADFDRL
jgi:cation diffusion facilitator CzcD-associated flavoprotein CzcO